MRFFFFFDFFLIFCLFLFCPHRRRGRETVGRGRAAVQHAAVRQRARAQRGAPAGADGERDGRGDAQPDARGRGAAAVGHARRRGRARVRGRAGRHHAGAVLRHRGPVVRAARHRVRGVPGRARETVPAPGRRGQRDRGRRRGVPARQDGRPRSRAIDSGKTDRLALDCPGTMCPGAREMFIGLRSSHFPPPSHAHVSCRIPVSRSNGTSDQTNNV